MSPAYSSTAANTQDLSEQAIYDYADRSLQRGSPQLARWQRAASMARTGVARGKVLCQYDSWGQLAVFNKMRTLWEQQCNGNVGSWVNASGLAGQGTQREDGWGGRNWQLTAGQAAQTGALAGSGFTAFYGQGTGTIEIWANSAKQGEVSTVAGPGVLDVPSASPFFTAIEIRATGGVVNFYGGYLWNGLVANTGVVTCGTHFAGNSIENVNNKAFNESMAFAQAFNPDLMCSALFINSDSSTYLEALDRFLAGFRAVCPTTSIVLHVTAQAGHRPDAPVTRRGVYACAMRYNAAVIDTMTVLGPLTADGSLSSDSVHLDTDGQAVFDTVATANTVATPLDSVATGGVVNVDGNPVASASYVDSYTLNPQTGTTYTVAQSDLKRGVVIVCTNAAAVTVTTPTVAAQGASFRIVQGGAGKVTIAAGSTIQAANKATPGIGQMVEWIQTANGWVSNGTTIA